MTIGILILSFRDLGSVVKKEDDLPRLTGS